jgi:hypothetical protein
VSALKQSAWPASAALLLLGASLGAPGEEFADRLKFQTEVGISVERFGYEEFSDSGRLLDREEGYLPGVSGSITALKGAWEFSLVGRFHAGTVDYDGQTNAGAPLKTETDQRVWDLGFTAGRRFNAPVIESLLPYLGVGYWRWQRDINPTAVTSGLSETYSWPYAAVGARAMLLRRERFEWQLDIGVVRPISPEVKVDFSGVFDSARLKLGSRTGYRAAMPLGWKFGRAKQITLEPFWERQAFGRSPTEVLNRTGMAVGTVFEPRSRAENYGLNLSLSFAL